MTETKVHTVAPPDEDELFEQQMAAMEQQAAAHPASDPVMDQELDRTAAFKKLMFLSAEHTEEREFGGLRFKFKVNRSLENSKILNMLNMIDNADAYKASILGLASTIVSVNGIPFEDFYTGDDSIKDTLLKKYNQICKWPSFMVTELMKLSTDVQVQVEKEFNRDFLAQ